ncbi:MAG: hypothetical protein WCI17_11055 [bacterium]
MEDVQADQISRRAWGWAVVAAFLFALGGVATWAQEFWVWIPQRVASVCIVLGLAASLWSLILATRVLFSGVALARRQNGSLLWTMLLAGVPPLAFVAWVLWMWLALGEKL